MSALPMPVYGLDKLYLYPYYQSREQYRAATGQEPPVFNPNLPPKYWADTAALSDPRRSVSYERVLAYDADGRPLRDANGSPVLEPLLLPKQVAGSVNIPPKQGANEPGADQQEVPPPLRALDPDEELFFGVYGVQVRNKKLFGSLNNAFTAQDREVLLAVARKLGVPLPA